MTVKELTKILSKAKADASATAGIRASMSRSLAASRSLDSALGRGTMFDGLTKIQDQMKWATGGLVSEALRARPGITGEARAGISVLSEPPFTKVNRALGTEILNSASLRVNLEPFASIAGLAGSKPLHDHFKLITTPLSAGITARLADIGRDTIGQGPALANVAGLADQFMGKSATADLNRIYRSGIAGVMPRLDSQALAGIGLKQGVAGLAQVDGLAEAFKARSMLDQLIPGSIQQFMRSSYWPQSVLRGFDLVRGVWQRRLALEAELDGTQLARLLFILDHIGNAQALELMERLAVEGIDPMLDLLEAALMAPEPIALLGETIKHAPHLRDSVRDDLGRGVDHIEEGDYQAALPDLMWGLEGAFRDGARARGNKKKRRGTQSAIVRIGLPHEREMFLRQAIYSNEGHDARHGEDADRRAFSLLAVVGFLCWFEEFTGQPAIEWLGRRLDTELRRETAELTAE